MMFSIAVLFFVCGAVGKVAPLCLVTPVAVEDFSRIGGLFESVSSQTSIPAEFILVVNSGRFERNKKGTVSAFDSSNTTNREWSIDESLEYAEKVLEAEGNALRDEYDDDDTLIKKDKKSEGHGKWVADMEESARNIIAGGTRLRVVLRPGRFKAGENRNYGSSLCSSGLISFFDSDDYMHPQRLEILSRMFGRHPELDAVLTQYITRRPSNYDECGPGDFNLYDIERVDLIKVSYKKIWESLKKRVRGNCEWYFGYQICHKGLKDTGMKGMKEYGWANGWITIKKAVLEKYPYNEKVSRAEDGLLNRQLIRHKVHFTGIPLPLGVYVNKNKFHEDLHNCTAKS